MPRVTIKYTAELEEVPEIISGLFEDAVASLKEAHLLARDAQRGAENRTRANDILELVEDSRHQLIKADQAFQDAADLLNGFESAMQSIDQQPNVPFEPPPPQGPPPQPVEPLPVDESVEEQ